MKIVCINGRIRTMDDRRSVVSAIAMEDGVITGLGNDEDVLALARATGEPNRIVELDGRTMLPGFFDGHMHLLSYGYAQSRSNLESCTSIEDLVRDVRNYIKARAIPDGAWVEGRGWTETHYAEGRPPNRHDLDRISDRHMIALGRSCSYSVVVNTMALKELGYWDHPPSTPAGIVEIGDDGRPTGVFGGDAVNLVFGRVPKLGVEGCKEAITAACRDYIKAGITSVDTDDFQQTRAGTFQDILQAYFELDEAGELPLRVHQMLYLPTWPLLEEFLELGYRTGDGSPFFRIGRFKLLADGSLGTRQAAVMEPYADDPNNLGVSLQSQKQLSAMMRRAFECGLDLVGDGIGDRGIYMLLKAYEPLVLENPDKDLRFGIDHSQITTEGIIEEYRRLGVIGGCELVFVASDIDIVEQRVGPHRASLSYNWKRFYDEGVVVTSGSDSPVEHYNPLLGIHAAVNRTNWGDEPQGGWLPGQKLSVDEAVRALTIGSAYAAREENLKGTLEIGKYADAVVLSEDIFTIDPARIRGVQVDMTFVDGRVAHEVQHSEKGETR